MKQKGWKSDMSKGGGSKEYGKGVGGERAVGRKDYLGLQEVIGDKVWSLKILTR